MASKDYTASLSNHNPSNYNKHADFVYAAKYTSAVLDLLNPQPGEAIADLGCGTGELTLKIKDAVGPNGTVWGIDSSQSMLDKASVAGEKVGIKFRKADIQDYTTLDPSLKGQFDAVFSSATFHWCKANPGGVIDTIKWLLKPGGRVSFEFGGFGNTVGIRSALHEVLRRRGIDPVPRDPWYFPTAEQYTNLLERHGMTPGSVALYPRPTPLTTDLVGWLTTFARNTFLAGLPSSEADALMQEVADICRPDSYWNDAAPGDATNAANTAGKDGWEIMYVRLRGIATL
ncbi:hypothetical protein VHUM_04010 [Vanrija humicola]|uniref:Methyltransferase domain-containing protein n=1 Tax=Vanrija humicola TaxID=5417 RepID=A0A7D8ZGY8_VANHU|nr:hypothetical protein VHUM_04010 [Vanrija humicola]